MRVPHDNYTIIIQVCDACVAPTNAQTQVGMSSNAITNTRTLSRAKIHWILDRTQRQLCYLRVNSAKHCRRDRRYIAFRSAITSILLLRHKIILSFVENEFWCLRIIDQCALNKKNSGQCDDKLYLLTCEQDFWSANRTTSHPVCVWNCAAKIYKFSPASAFKLYNIA